MGEVRRQRRTRTRPRPTALTPLPPHPALKWGLVVQTEMMGKLMELGDKFLGMFGMSTANFKTVKDPQTGSYSISFQQ